MTSKEHTQRRILNLVELYKKAFPEEYKIACNGVIMSRELLKHETGNISGEHAGVSAQRVLYEIPEKLYQSFYKELDGDELTYFKSKEGGRWFAKNVPQFSLVKI